MACCFMLSFLSWNIQCFSQIWNSLSVKTQIITSFQYAIWCWSLNKWQMGYETGLSAFHLLISDVSSRLCVFSTYHVIGFRDSPQAGKQSGFCCVVLQAATSSECEEIVNRIGERETTLIHSIHVMKELCQVLIINIIFLSPQLLGSNIQNGLYENSDLEWTGHLLKCASTIPILHCYIFFILTI